MRWKTVVVLPLLLAVSAAGSAKVKVVVQNGRKVILNDGVGEKHAAGIRRTSDEWLAARISHPTEYDQLIARAAGDHSLDPRLVKSVMLVESRSTAYGISPKGARSLTPLMPATATSHGGTFGRPASGKAVRLGRDANNRPVLTTGRRF